MIPTPFLTPSGLNLGKYDRSLLSTLAENGGKLGVLEYIASFPTLVNKFKDIGVICSKESNPLIIK